MSMPNNMPKSILKKSVYKPGRKRLFSKLNTLIYTNGFDELAEEQIMTFIAKPYQLVRWRGVDPRKLDPSDNIMIDIGAETTNLPAICEFLVVKNGAAKENGDIVSQVIVRDAGLQVNTKKNTKSIDFYSIQRFEQTKQSIGKSDQCWQTDPEENKKELTPKPTEDKSIATDDILDSLPELKDFSIKDLMSTSCQNCPKPESCFVNDLKKDKRYRDSESQVKKLEEKCPLTDTKRLVHITNFFDYEHGENYEEYEVNDFLCDTEDLARYFNFDSYNFGDLLSGKIRVQVKPKESDPFKLIDIKIKGPGTNTSEVGTLTDESLVKKNPNSNKITQTDKNIESKKYPAKHTEIKCLPAAPIKLSRKTSGFDDIINSMNKKIQAVNQIASKNQFDNLKNDRKLSQISQSSQNDYSDVWSQNSTHNEKLESHIEKYYNTSTLKYPLISKAMNKKAKRSSLSNSCRSESYCSLRNDSPAVDYLSDYRSCAICNRRRKTCDKSGQKHTTPFSSFDNLVKKSTDLAENKNYAHEYLVDNSFILDCESELFDTSRYLRANHDKMLSMYANNSNSSITKK